MQRSGCWVLQAPRREHGLDQVPAAPGRADAAHRLHQHPLGQVGVGSGSPWPSLGGWGAWEAAPSLLPAWQACCSPFSLCGHA